MVCNSNSIDCQPGFGAIEILIVSVIVLSFVGIALTVLCCLCRQYNGDYSPEDSDGCLHVDDRAGDDENGSNDAADKLSSSRCLEAGFPGGGRGGGGGGGGGGGLGREKRMVSGRNVWDDIPRDGGDVYAKEKPCSLGSRTANICGGREAWNRVGDGSERGSAGKSSARGEFERGVPK